VALTDKDLPLKLNVLTIFRRLGFIAFAEVDLCTYTYQTTYKRKQITDFDVLGVRVEPDLTSKLAVAECKTAEERAMENLLKLNGVKCFFGADTAYFVQQRIDENAREVGAELGIVCLDARNLKSLMASMEIREDREVELESRVYSARAAILEEQKAVFRRQTEYLKFDFWTLPDNRNIINLVRLMRQMGEAADVSKRAHVVLGHQLVTALALSVLRVAGVVVRQNIDDMPEGLLTVLLGGSRERRDREALHDAVAKIVPDGGFSLIPEFFPRLAELATRYLKAMSHAHSVAACLDEMTRRILLGASEFPAISSVFGERTLKLARDAIYLATEIGGLPKEMFGESLSDQKV
jgi:hypothetical protein